MTPKKPTPACIVFHALLVGGFLLLLSQLALAAPAYTVIDFPSTTATTLTGINNMNQIVGYYNDLNTGLPTGLLYQNGVFTTISVPGGQYTNPAGINDSGTIVGAYNTSDGHTHAFLYDGSTYTTVDSPGAIITKFVGINNAGLVVGWAQDSLGQVTNFEWFSGTFTTVTVTGATNPTVGGINNLGDIVGTYITPQSSVAAFLLATDGTRHVVFYPDSQSTSGLGLNDLRAVVGEIQSPQQGRTLGFGFIFGVYTRIVPPGTAKAGFSIAAGINNAGDIVGTYMDASFVDHGFLRTP
jgi:probable HAF family extracellular repeat protein